MSHALTRLSSLNEDQSGIDPPALRLTPAPQQTLKSGPSAGVGWVTGIWVFRIIHIIIRVVTVLIPAQAYSYQMCCLLPL